MEKARAVDAELGQNNSAYFKIADGKAYKDLAKFVKEHQDTTKGYSEDEGKQLDQLINDLKSAISLKWWYYLVIKYMSLLKFWWRSKS